jgi:hypothetical protein
MKLRKALLPALALATIVTTALAFQIVVKADAQNVVAARVAGAWKVEPTITKRLDPDHPNGTIGQITFYENATVLADLVSQAPRFKELQVFSSGNVSVDGAAHPYLIYNENGNMKVMWFVPNDTSPIGRSETKTLQVAVSRDRTQDILILGGDVRGEPSSAFLRAP